MSEHHGPSLQLVARGEFAPDDVFGALLGGLTEHAGHAFEWAHRETPSRALIAVHPAGWPVVVDVPVAGGVVLTAFTGETGPGLHRFVRDAVRHLAETALEVEFELRDSAQGDVDAAFDAHLGRVAAQALEVGASLGLGADLGSPEVAGQLMTAQGVFVRDWLESAARSPEAHREVWSWWSGEAPPSVARARAAAMLGVAWRAPRTEEEREYAEAILEEWAAAQDASAARAGDRAWREALTRIAEAEAPEGHARGIRAGQVSRRIAGDLWLTFPGDLAEHRAEEGMLLFDDERSVHISGAAVPSATPADNLEMVGAPPGHALPMLPEDDALHALATRDDEGGGTSFHLSLASAEAVATISITGADEAFARATFESAHRSFAGTPEPAILRPL